MREKISFVIRCLSLLVCIPLLTAARDRADAVLNERLDQLYDSVSAKFARNPWFKNSADPDVEPRGSRNVPPVPEYQMMDRDLFKGALKAYCTLLESPASKTVKNRAHYGIVNFSQPSGERRLYIYDIPTQEILHNLWTSHGWNSRLGFWYSLKDSGFDELSAYRKEVAMSRSDNPNATLFSNRNGSNQSSVGMAVADTQTYFSAEKQWTALRLSGVDGALNSNLRPRAVVFHEWGYNGETMRWYHEAPLSEGCPMLPKSGTYRGVPGADIAKIIMGELYGSPVFFYHERMQSSANETAYQSQLQTMKDLRIELGETMSRLQGEYGWDNASKDRYESVFASKLDGTYSPLVSETYRYFKNRSLYYGVEPKNPSACMKALGL